MIRPLLVLFPLAWIGIAPAQEPPPMHLPLPHSAAGRAAPVEQPRAVEPASLYRSRGEASAAAFQAAYRAATVEHNRMRAIRLFLVALHRDAQNPAALFNMALLCELEERWSDALSFLGEAHKLEAPNSDTARAVSAEIPRAEAIARLEQTAEGKTRRQYDLALMAAIARSKDPYAGLAAIGQLGQIDKTRWETPALAGTLHARTGQFADSVRDLQEATRLADASRAPGLKSAAEAAAQEAGYLELARTADPLWEKREWEQAAKTYEQAWDKSPRHTNAAMLAVTGYLMIDQLDPAVRLLARLRCAAAPAGTRATAMLQALAPVSETARKTAALPAEPPAAEESDPASRISALAGSLTNTEMELVSAAAPKLLADQTHVIPLPDKELDAGDDSWALLSTESLYQRFQSGLNPNPAPPPAAASPAAEPASALPAAPPPAMPPAPTHVETPSEAEAPAAAGDGVSIQSDPPGARAIVDHTATCITPCLIALAPGPHHTLQMQLAGYRDALRIFDVPRNAPAPPVRVTLDAKIGMLEVDSDPAGAPVTLDGRPTDKRTPATFHLSEGEHMVGVEVDGKIRNEKVSVTDSGMIKVRF
jgi:tetratricopeptide (TPR) repeat protein